MSRTGIRRALRAGTAVGAALGTIVLTGGIAAAAYTPTPTPSWSPTSGTVYALARVGNSIVLGGSFTALRSPDNSTTVSRNRLAAIDATTGNLLSWNPGANGDVRALEASSDSSSVFVGGAFTTAGGTARSRIADLRISDGTPVGGFSATASDTVRALKRIGSTLYLGGAFTSVNSSTRQHIAALSASTGSLVSGFSATANGSVYTVADAPTSGNLVVGGKFTTLGGAAHNYIAQISASTGAATSWAPTVCPSVNTSNPCYVYGSVHDSSNVYAAVGGPGGRLVALNAGGSRVWTDTADGDFQAIGIQGSTIYGGGHFYEQVAGQPRAGLVAVASSNGAVSSSFAPRVKSGLGTFAILTGSDYLRIGGGFTNVDSTGEMRYTAFPTA